MVVDDHVLIRKGLILLLELYPDITIVGEAGNGNEAITTALKTNPDVILMDISMPSGLDGYTAAKNITNDLPHTKIILLTMHDEEVYIQKAIQVRAHGYILKKSQGNELYEAIRSVYNGKRFYKVGMSEEQLKKMFEAEKPRSILTIREQEVVHLTILGFSNKQVSEKLVISPKTVENHKSNIMQKLRLKDKHELIQYGLNNGYLELWK